MWRPLEASTVLARTGKFRLIVVSIESGVVEINLQRDQIPGETLPHLFFSFPDAKTNCPGI
jgi:hypothetical protein